MTWFLIQDIKRAAIAAAAATVIAAAIAAAIPGAQAAEPKTLLNVSYGPTRELSQEFNSALVKHGKARIGEDLKIRDRHIGFVFQHYALFRHMSVAENVAFGLEVRKGQDKPGQAEINDPVAGFGNCTTTWG